MVFRGISQSNQTFYLLLYQSFFFSLRGLYQSFYITVIGQKKNGVKIIRFENYKIRIKIITVLYMTQLNKILSKIVKKNNKRQ